MSHPARYRHKFAQSRGEGFNHLRRNEVSKWATKRQLQRLKELKVKYKRKGLTWVRAKALIKEAIQAKNRLGKILTEQPSTTSQTSLLNETTKYNPDMETYLNKTGYSLS